MIRKKCANPECDLNVSVESEHEEKLCAQCAMFLKINEKSGKVEPK